MLELDQRFFCKDALKKLKSEQDDFTPKDLVSCLMHIFTHNSFKKEDEDGEDNNIEKITKLNTDQSKSSLQIECEITPNQLSPSYIAGICLLDLI